jgi:hypothetical protein
MKKLRRYSARELAVMIKRAGYDKDDRADVGNYRKNFGSQDLKNPWGRK